MSRSASARKKAELRRKIAETDALNKPMPPLPQDGDTDHPDYFHGPNKEIFDTVEDMLRLIHKREDPRQTVDKMRLCFGCGNAMFRADRYVLEKLGMNRLDAIFFSLVPEISRYTERTSYGEHPDISRLETASRYLVSNFVGLQIECFYLFCVNQHGRLKARILLHKGIEDRALFSLNRLMTEVLRADPAAIIVAHNHPRGTLRPSEADIRCTEDIINAAAMLDVPLLDHVIVANRSAVSLRDNGFIPEKFWLAQDPDNRFLRNWLLPPPPKKEKKPKVLTPEELAAAREKEIQSLRRHRRRQMEKAQRQYRSHMRQAEKALRIYRQLCTIEAMDRNE